MAKQIHYQTRDELEAEVKNLKEQNSEYVALAIRTKAILDDESFWGKTSTENGWHSSLHKDLTKACDKSKELNATFKAYHSMIKTLETELEELKSRTCEGCKYSKLSEDNNGRIFGFCANEKVAKIQPELGLLFPLNIIETFGCNKWEQK